MPDDERPGCPNCFRGEHVLPILYGTLIESWAREHKGEFAWGGCGVWPGAPIWVCRHCDHRWGEFELDLPLD